MVFGRWLPPTIHGSEAEKNRFVHLLWQQGFTLSFYLSLNLLNFDVIWAHTGRWFY